MKITIALSALVAMAATVVCASPIVSEPSTNSTHSLSKRDCKPITLTWVRIPRNPDASTKPHLKDLHYFSLEVSAQPHYYNELKFQTSQGNPSNKWRGLRKSEDGLWSVVFYTGKFDNILLRANRNDYTWKKPDELEWDP
ncbi:hypothetical protein BGZ97_005772, partial [Linnemannia gamsii]